MDHLPTIFSQILCINAATQQHPRYSYALRMEGQVLCLAKHHSTENRELVATAQIEACVLGMYSSGNTKISTKTLWKTLFASLCLKISCKFTKLHNGPLDVANGDAACPCAEQQCKDLLDL